MCGLVGVAGQLALKDEKLMKHLLMFDYFRGPDSTGLAAVRGNGDVYLSKLASHPVDLFDTAKFKAALSGHNSRAFIGHNRAATRGVVNGVNAHPFVFNHIVGAHNGTLETSCMADLEKACGEKHNVDSQTLFAAIAAIGIEATIPMTQGAWSLVWYDMKEGTLNFLRNKERPMWYAYTADFTRLIWASQWEFIHAAAMSNDMDLFTDTSSGRPVQFWQTEEDTHYSFNLAELGKTKERPKPKAKKLEGKPKYVAMTGNYSGGSGVTGFFPVRESGSNNQQGSTTQSSTRNGGTRNSSGGTRNSTGTGLVRNGERTVSVTTLNGNSEKPFAGVVSREDFDELAKNGCSWCESSVHWGDKGIVVLQNVPAIIGPCCTRRSDQNRIMTAVDYML